MTCRPTEPALRKTGFAFPLTVALLFSMFLTETADVHAYQLTGGLKGGINQTHDVISGFPSFLQVDVAYRSLDIYGAFVSVHLLGPFEVAIEPRSIRNGSKVLVQQKDHPDEIATWEFRYFEVPILLRYQLNLGPFHIRPYLGYALTHLSSATEKIGNEITDLKDDTQSSDNNYQVGVAFQYHFKRHSPSLFITTDVRITWGRNNIVRPDFPLPLSVKSRSFQFLSGIGYAFHL